MFKLTAMIHFSNVMEINFLIYKSHLPKKRRITDIRTAYKCSGRKILVEVVNGTVQSRDLRARSAQELRVSHVWKYNKNILLGMLLSINTWKWTCEIHFSVNDFALELEDEYKHMCIRQNIGYTAYSRLQNNTPTGNTSCFIKSNIHRQKKIQSKKKNNKENYRRVFYSSSELLIQTAKRKMCFNSNSGPSSKAEKKEQQILIFSLKCLEAKCFQD